MRHNTAVILTFSLISFKYDWWYVSTRLRGNELFQRRRQKRGRGKKLCAATQWNLENVSIRRTMTQFRGGLTLMGPRNFQLQLLPLLLRRNDQLIDGNVSILSLLIKFVFHCVRSLDDNCQWWRESRGQLETLFYCSFLILFSPCPFWCECNFSFLHKRKSYAHFTSEKTQEPNSMLLLFCLFAHFALHTTRYIFDFLWSARALFFLYCARARIIRSIDESNQFSTDYAYDVVLWGTENKKKKTELGRAKRSESEETTFVLRAILSFTQTTRALSVL